jgi:hypothetical protein
MSERPDERHIKPASKWKFALVGALAAPVLIALGVYLYAASSSSSRLKRAIATADRLDPNWRLGPLIERRFKPKDDDNSAEVVIAMANVTPRRLRGSAPGSPPISPIDNKSGPPEGRALDTLIEDLKNPIALRADVRAALAAEIDDKPEAIALGQKLLEMGEGHHKIVYNKFSFNTLLTHLQTSRGVANFLRKDLLLRADEGDISGAVRSSRIILGIGRSLGDEEFAISQLFRIACETMSMNGFERALSQGETTDAELTAAQRDYAKEDEQPLLLYALRGERATTFDALDQAATGEVDATQFTAATGTGGGGTSTVLAVALQFGAFSRHNQAVALEMMNDAVEIAKRPTHEQNELWERWSNARRSPGGLAALKDAMVRLVAPAGENLAKAYQRSRALLRAGQLMAACERFRIADGRWPNDQGELIPVYLPHALLDPYDGKPLRIKRITGGLAVYALGEDQKDDGGKFDRRKGATGGYDVGLRLWDVDKRHQAPQKLEKGIAEATDGAS